jgi:hypothetical protein
VRIEASRCILEMCRSDETNLKLFLSCGGVQYLIDALVDATSHSVAYAIETVIAMIEPSFFSEDSINVLARSEFVFQLSNTLVNMTKNLSAVPSSLPPSPASSFSSERSQSGGLRTDANEPIILNLVAKISHILCVFADGDSFVKSQLMRSPIFSNLLSSVVLLHAFCVETEGSFDQCRFSLITLLKVTSELLSFYDLSAKSNSSFHRVRSADLSEAEDSKTPSGVLELKPVAQLEAEITTMLSTIVCSKLVEPQQLALCILHKFCNGKNRFRLEQTALAPGLLQQLQSLAISPQPSLFRQYAFDLLLGFPKASVRVRSELKKYGGPQFYLDLREPTWGPSIFEVICDWLVVDTKRVELVLRTPTNLNRLFMILRDTNDTSAYVKLLPLFSRLISGSSSIGLAFTQSKALPAEISSRFQRHASNNIIRSSLLTILKQICQLSTNPMELIMRQIKVYRNPSDASGNSSAPEGTTTTLFAMLCELKKDTNNPYVAAQALQVLIACDRTVPIKPRSNPVIQPTVLKPAPPAIAKSQSTMKLLVPVAAPVPVGSQQSGPPASSKAG